MDRNKKFGGNGGGNDRKGGFGGRDGGRQSFGNRDSGRSNFGGRDDRGPATMHKVDCSDCGKTAEVPFKPTGDKPVYCNNCFGDKRESPSKRFDTRFDKKPMGNPGYTSTPRTESKPDPRVTDLKIQIDALHSKIDRVIEMIRKDVFVPGMVTAKAPKPTPAPVSKPKQAPVKEVAKAPKSPAKKVPVKKVVAKKIVKKVVEKKAVKKVTKK